MKKIIAFILTAVMLVSAVSTMAFADEVVAETVIEETTETVTEEIAETTEEVVVEDNKNAELYASVKEEAGLVKTLGIMTGVTEENIDEEIPRGKFVEHILRFAALGPAKSSGMQQFFTDVVEGSEYYDAVTTAAMVGLIHGNGQGVFLPEKNITYNEAIKMIVGALGYGAVAEARGGYPMGYIAVASDLKLLKGINLGGTENLNNANGVKLIFNALNANAAEMNVNSDNSLSMSSLNMLYLEDTFNVEKFKGIVTGTQVTRQLEGKEYLGWVEIDEIEYEVIASEYFNEEDLLGMAVYYYVQYDEEVTGDTRDGKIIMISPMDDRNTVIDVIDEDIDPSTSVNSFNYWESNNKSVKKNITDATVYYNGLNCEGYLAPDGSDLRPVNGNVRLIDNNRDGKIDVVIIEDYTEYVVDFGATTKIAVKYYNPEDPNPDNIKEITIGDREDIIIVRDGVVITPDFLGQWESLKVMQSKNGGAYIRVFGDSVNGIIETVNEEEIKMGGVVYEYADMYKEALAAHHYQAYTDKRGSTVTLRLNEDGKVIGMSATITDVTEYGYLVRVVDESGLNPKSHVKIFCMYGSMNIYECAENVKVNGRKVEGSLGSVFNAYNAQKGDYSGRTNDQLIKYTRKGDKVTSIYTANDATGGAESVYGAADNENFTLNYQRTSTAWNFVAGTNVLESQYVITTSVIPTFWIPKDLTEESLFKFYETASSINGLDKNTEMYIYDATLLEPQYNIFTPAVLVVKDKTERDEISESNPYILSSIPNSNAYHVVDIVETTLDGSGNEVYQITTTTGTVIGFEHEVYNVDTTNLYGYGSYTLGELEPGDIIQVDYGNDDAKANRFVVIKTAADYSDEEQPLRWWTTDRSDNAADIYASPGTANALLTGEIIYENHPTYIVRTQNYEGEDQFLMLSYAAVYPQTTGTVYVYERGSKEPLVATSAQLAAGKRVMMHIRNNGYMGLFIVVVTD